jgi:transposase
MIGRKDRWHQDLFVVGPLDNLVPKDHILRQIREKVDLSWVVDEVRDSYCEYDGRPSVDPESALCLLIAGYFYDIVHHRELLRMANENIAIRWFVGYRLDEKLPVHSALGKIVDRWGEQRFKRIFKRVVKACVDAGLVDGKTIHIDATLIRADVSWESMVEEHTDRVVKENAPEAQEAPGTAARVQDPRSSKRKPGRPRTRPVKAKKHSTTDPEATLATSSHNRKLEPCFKDHIAVDDKSGVIVDVAVTTGEASEGKQLLEQIVRVESNTGQPVEVVTGDAGYAHPKNYAELEKRQIDAIIPPQPENRHVTKLPLRRFKYDAKHQIVRCPQGKKLYRSHEARDHKGWVYRARVCDCRNCPLRARCVSAKAHSRTVMIVNDYEALLRARRRKAKGWDEETKELYNRHRWRSEGKNAEAKERHGLRRAVRRGREKVGIQAYLTAIVMNLKVLVGPFVTQRNQMVLWIIYGHHSVILVLHEVAESISRAETPYPARMAA